MTKMCFVPRNDNEEDRELEGVYNVWRLYKLLTLTILETIIFNRWAVSSAGERLLDEEKVVGSTPTPPTIFLL